MVLAQTTPSCIRLLLVLIAWLVIGSHGAVAQSSPPIILAQPQSVGADVGADVSFTVSATSATPMAYQWRKNSAAIAGATTAILTLTNVQWTNVGSYSVVISNDDWTNSVTSSTALLGFPVYQPYLFKTLAGQGGVTGSADGTNNEARFYTPTAAVLDNQGNLFVAELNNSVIRKVSPTGNDWVVTTIAGKAGVKGFINGTNDTARFWYPNGITMDSEGNLYVTDRNNAAIRKISPAGTNWVVSTIAAGLDSFLGGIAIDNSGTLFFAEVALSRIRKVTGSGTNWVVSNVAGLAYNYGSSDGTNSGARFYQPDRVAVDGSGNLYVSDYLNHTIRKITPDGTNWVVSTLAGKAAASGLIDAAGASARFNLPEGLAVDAAGNVFVGDVGNKVVRKISPDGFVTTVGGRLGAFGAQDGAAAGALFGSVLGIVSDTVGNVYLAENHTIRKGQPAIVLANMSAPSIQQANLALRIAAASGLSCRLQASTDFQEWNDLTNFTSTGMYVNFVDAVTSNQDHRFYRVVSP